MPRRRFDRNGNGEIPLPVGWEVGQDYDGKVFYIDHNSHQTSWIDPRDRFTKPATFADCIGEELPYGWEQSCDPHIGVYFVDHVHKINQLEDPRMEWRAQQEAMLQDYLAHAQDDLQAKKEIYHVRQERLVLAQEEVQHLNQSLNTPALNPQWTSRTSLNSAASGASTYSTKYDPDLLKADVAIARRRLARLRQEVDQAQAEMQYAEQGLNTLQYVEDKMGVNGGQPMYNVEQAQHIMCQIQANQQNISLSNRHKHHLIQSLAKLKENMNVGQSGSYPDVSQEKLSTACQTDVTGQLYGVQADNRLAEIVRMQLQYDEAYKQVNLLQQQLSDIENKMDPAQTMSDKDRLLLIQEKEQLLRELRSINTAGRSPEEIQAIGERVSQLELDLTNAVQLSNIQIAERLKLNESKEAILTHLGEATRLATYLQSQLKSLSASTLSVSSGSSRGSLGSLSASSKGSLASASITDIYSSYQTTPEVNIVELHKRVEKILQGHSPGAPVQPTAGSRESLVSGLGSNAALSVGSHSTRSLSSGSSASPPVSLHENGPPPSYEQHVRRQQDVPCGVKTVINEDPSVAPIIDRMSELTVGSNPNIHRPHTVIHSHHHNVPGGYSYNQHASPGVMSSCRLPAMETLSEGSSNPPLSPISESSSGVGHNMSGLNTRSVSAAVSDESVAGDSGVFDGIAKRGVDGDGIPGMESAQVQIKLRYDISQGCLLIGLEQARNLYALGFPNIHCQVCVRASLLPSPDKTVFSTKPVTQLNCPQFLETFSVPVPEHQLCAKTLQIYVWCLQPQTKWQHCLGSTQISLSSFDARFICLDWYNVLSFRFMQPESATEFTANTDTSKDHIQSLLEDSSVHLKNYAASNMTSTPAQVDAPRPFRLRGGAAVSTISTVKEESSDESTIISSQTSTLTRNQGGPGDLEEESGIIEDYQGVTDGHGDEEEDDTEVDQSTIKPSQTPMLHALLSEQAACGNLVSGLPLLVATNQTDSALCDKQTNTEATVSKHQPIIKRRSGSHAPDHTHSSSSTPIRRSQTFSPVTTVVPDYLCKLNRSDSDSSVGTSKLRRGPFQRNTSERRSMRMKRPTLAPIKKSRSFSGGDCLPIRTSLDLELDLQASQARLSQLSEEITRLEVLKKRMEEAVSEGRSEPAWLSSSDQLQQFLALAESLASSKREKHSGRGVAGLEEKAERLLQRVVRDSRRERLSQKGPAASRHFKEKMAFFTNMSLAVPAMPSGESDLDDPTATSDSTVTSESTMTSDRSVTSEPITSDPTVTSPDPSTAGGGDS